MPPPDEGHWELDASSGLWWCEAEQLYFDPMSGHFYDPVEDAWHDPDTNQWYKLQ